MFLKPSNPRITRLQQLASRPLRLVQGELAESENGGARLRVPLRKRRWSGWLLRLPKDATKTFEFDALGKFVWNHCDGKTSVQQIARKLARTYNVSERESLVATEKFLTTLANKGLIGASILKGNAKANAK
jgi:hypothetical protein